MPDPYLGMRYQGTKLAHKHCEEIGLSLTDVLSALQNSVSWSVPNRADQFWHRGETPQGVELKILIEVNRPAGITKVILVNLVRK